MRTAGAGERVRRLIVSGRIVGSSRWSYAFIVYDLQYDPGPECGALARALCAARSRARAPNATRRDARARARAPLYHATSPDFSMRMSAMRRPLFESESCTLWTTSMPRVTRPNATLRPSRCGHGATVM